MRRVGYEGGGFAEGAVDEQMYVCTVALLIGSICPNADLALLSLQISLLPIRYRRPMVDLEHNVDYGCFVLRTLDCTSYGLCSMF